MSPGKDVGNAKPGHVCTPVKDGKLAHHRSFFLQVQPDGRPTGKAFAAGGAKLLKSMILIFHCRLKKHNL